MSRFFVPKENISINQNTITITGSDVNHIKNVLRKKIGDKIICFTSNGFEYLANISYFEKDRINLSLVSRTAINIAPKTKIILGQGIPKNPKMDQIIKAAAELGVFEIVPIICERSIVKKGKYERWQKIAKKEAELSNSPIVPIIKYSIDLKEFLGIYKDADLKIMPWESEENSTLKDALKNRRSAKDIVLLIGPEGGFSNREVSLARSSGFNSVSLGKRILRAEIAASAAIAMIIYELEL